MAVSNNIWLIYDEACPFCRASLVWILQRAKEDCFSPLPVQTAREQLALTEEQFQFCERAVCVFYPDRQFFHGVDALARILRKLRGWTWLGLLLTLPGIHGAGRIVYGLIARHRYVVSRLLGIQAEDRCDTGHCGR
ncbi:MAG: DCC1-like thiol-disulfide oxidoreductase family protein [Candidatus Hydrogenedentales bacterium]|jgi:predicted DCC family thiol-disulfide oxidoreductase YuxK